MNLFNTVIQYSCSVGILRKGTVCDLPQSSVSLSIICPPQNTQVGTAIWNNESEFLELVRQVLEKTAFITKPGGICCLVLSYEFEDGSERLIPMPVRVLKSIHMGLNKSPWSLIDELIWVKGTKEKKIIKPDEAEMVANFKDIPFSQIFVLEKKEPTVERATRQEVASKMPESNAVKDEMSDVIWYVQPSSENVLHGSIHNEIVRRLELIYSKEGDLVFEPFSVDGVVGTVSKTLKRNFACLAVGKDEAKRLKNILSAP